MDVRSGGGPAVSRSRCSRSRFAAHEYAHALLDREGTVSVSSTGNSADLVEKRANACVFRSKPITFRRGPESCGSSDMKESTMRDIPLR